MSHMYFSYYIFVFKVLLFVQKIIIISSSLTAVPSSLLRLLDLASPLGQKLFDQVAILWETI